MMDVAAAGAALEQEEIVLGGEDLRIEAIARAAHGAPVGLSPAPEVRARIAASRAYIERASASGKAIYGVNTLFGGMADHVVTHEAAAALQRNLLWSHKSAAGERLPREEVRAAMLLRAHSLSHGISGVRIEVIERLLACLNGGLTPEVRECGSIGASGDLVPLAYIAGAVTGLSEAYHIEYEGQWLPAPAALAARGLAPLPLEAKEGLALINGTSAMTGIAALCVARARQLAALTLGTHALLLQSLGATVQSFHPFIHDAKPHTGQVAAAAAMRHLLDGSHLVAGGIEHQLEHRAGDLLQDRYSIRCLPQFVGPMLDGLNHIAAQIEVEANSVTDNPLIDAEAGCVYHGGNFLGQYTAMAMDQLRYQLGLLARHLDVQIALTVAPEFNHGLPPSLVGNETREINLGLKALQLTSNSITPMLGFYGNSLADRFPAYAEQYNQNVNSLGYGSAILARRALDLFEIQTAIGLVFAVQAVELRSRQTSGNCDATARLAPASAPVYAAVHAALGQAPRAGRPLIYNDDEQALDAVVEAVRRSLAHGGALAAAARTLRGLLHEAAA